jgi:hypothetical protein
MRVFLWLALALLSFCSLRDSVHAVGARASRAPQTPTGVANGPGVVGKLPDLVQLWSFEVKGVGTTPNAARTDPDALERACQELGGYLRRHHPDVDWQPTVEYLEQAKLIQPVGEPSEKLSDRGDMYYVVGLRVSLNNEQLRELRQTARQHRVEQRQHLAFLGLIALSIFLVVALGYLKLEEMTRGFYTNLLRAAAFGVLILSGIALWLLH